MLAAVKQLKMVLDQTMLQQYEELYTDPTEDDDNHSQMVIDALSAEFQEQLNLIRCSAHTLQLAVLDVINKSDDSVKEVTAIAKKCRGIKYKTHFDCHNASVPPVFNQTRWGGIYDLIHSFHVQRDFFEKLAEDFPELGLTNDNWIFIEHYVQAFKPLYVCTKKLQEKHVSLPDFYLYWLKAISELSNFPSNPFAPQLIKSLTRRLEALKTSRAFQMALYLDPRFNFLNSKFFKVEEKLAIQGYIIDTYERIQKLKPMNGTDDAEQSGTSQHSQFDDFLTEMLGGSLDDSTTSDTTTFIQQVKALDGEPRQGFSHNVWEYWMRRQKTHPELFTVAMVVLAAPSNQVSVERAFSGLALVLSPHRAGLGSEVLEDILLIKLNRDIFEQIMPSYEWKEFTSAS
nr:uncharacterized protein LOC115258770 [Aedes albopictus]